MSAACLWAFALCAQAADVPAIEVLREFAPELDQARVENAREGSASDCERAGNVLLPGFFLHPSAEGDAVARFTDVAIPPEGDCYLLFRIGMKDGVQWEDAANAPNGARFTIAIEEVSAFSEALAAGGWHMRLVDLAPWHGQSITVEFRTNAINGNSHYDWCLFGDPILIAFNGTSNVEQLSPDDIGVCVAEINCTETAEVALTMGRAREEAAVLPPGVHKLPVQFNGVGAPKLEVSSGTAEIVTFKAAPYPGRIAIKSFALSSPLVTAGRRFDVLLTIRNEGRGVYRGGDAARLSARGDMSLAALGKTTGETPALGPLRPRQEETLFWRDLTAEDRTDWTLACSLGEFESETTFHVFDPEPETRTEHAETPSVPLLFANPIRAEVANAFSRLSIVAETNADAYAIAETWDGTKWRRVGSLYPLVRVVIPHKDGAPEELALAFESMEAENGVLTLHGRARSADDRAWPIHVVLQPEPDAPRIQIGAIFGGPHEVEVLAFSGPTVLAGDRSFGTAKQAALFPGIEFLKGEEVSSSERDLAYPLNERSVPAAHKITVPLMAVQGRDSLIALLWDPHQEWTPNQRFPAARFNAPHADTGLDYVHLSLFAPTVGPYVPENHSEAKVGYQLGKLEHMTLRYALVLDNKRRYASESVVNGPHESALLLQAVQHWLDAAGFPESTPPPREWNETRALSRDAFLNTVWNDEPPGWRATRQAIDRLGPGLAVPLLADIRAGVDAEIRGEVEQRVNLLLKDVVNKGAFDALCSPVGTHLHSGELPFYFGFLPESLAPLLDNAAKRCNNRTNELWVWRPADARRAVLGTEGDHTLGQAALPSFQALRAARLTGDANLRRKALEAMTQMQRYDVPRGAQTWECPLRQPDILAAAQAVLAYCEAYRLTNDTQYLNEARYWASCGLPFVYLWSFKDRPAMLFNTIPAFGSTFHVRSWLGQPVIWNGLVYAYVLQDLAEFDDSFPWRKVAQGILSSALQQQYREGPSKGCYPDSWHIPDNRPCPPDINPEAILLNGLRLYGPSPHIRFAQIGTAPHEVCVNSLADIDSVSGGQPDGTIKLNLTGTSGFPCHTLLAPVPEPTDVTGVGPRLADSNALFEAPEGWLYSKELNAVVIKHKREKVACEVRW